MSAGKRKGVILNVDDDTAARYARNRLLRNAGYEVVDASNGGEALAALKSAPQLVILDVGLPDIDGFEVCRRIKESASAAPIAVLQVSASFVRSEDRTRALEGGADNFLIEPVEPEVLIATVNAMLRMQNAEREVLLSARAWEATFDAIDEGVALLDASGRVTRCNQALEQLLGVDRPRILGRKWSELLGDAVPDSVDARPLSTKVGDRSVQSHVSPGVNGHPAIAVLRDVTDHVVALDAAREANRLKDDFLAILSHELRTPLNAIVGWAHMLQTGRLDAAATQRAVLAISRNAQVQSKLISDILDVSRIIAGKLRLERTTLSLNAIVEAALDTIRPMALAKEIRVELVAAPELAVEGEAARLQQVVWNLLSNAVKFAPRGGSVKVELASTADDVELQVHDDGPGIQPEFLPYVFDRFRQADSSMTRAKGGLGLGLAIVRHIVELHGGTVHAANCEKGPGAIFRVKLARAHALVPRRAVAATDGDRPPAMDPARLRGARILVVDDEEDARDLIATVLSGSGAVVDCAASVNDAVALAERATYQLVLSDLEMPGEDGYSLLRRIRGLPPPNASMPAGALTAYARPDDTTRVMQAGFDAHIIKPVSPADLVSNVDALLALRPQP